MAVKSALLGTRHPRKEKEAALQNVTGEPACHYGKIRMITQSEMEPSIKIKELKSVAHNRRGRQSTGPRKACCRVPPPKGERHIWRKFSNILANLPNFGKITGTGIPLLSCWKCRYGQITYRYPYIKAAIVSLSATIVGKTSSIARCLA